MVEQTWFRWKTATLGLDPATLWWEVSALCHNLLVTISMAPVWHQWGACMTSVGCFQVYYNMTLSANREACAGQASCHVGNVVVKTRRYDDRLRVNTSVVAAFDCESKIEVGSKKSWFVACTSFSLSGWAVRKKREFYCLISAIFIPELKTTLLHIRLGVILLLATDKDEVIQCAWTIFVARQHIMFFLPWKIGCNFPRLLRTLQVPNNLMLIGFSIE